MRKKLLMPLNERVEYYISRIIEKFEENPELFLTESDLKCRLFKELDNDPVFSQEELTRDGEKRTSYVHSETSYFVFGKLNKNRVDITVVKPSNYDFLNKKVVDRKGFYFTEPSIGIELKLNKKKNKKGMEKELKDVLRGLNQLKNSRPESAFYVLLLDKKKVFSNEDVRNLQRENQNIGIFYTSIHSY